MANTPQQGAGSFAKVAIIAIVAIIGVYFVYSFFATPEKKKADIADITGVPIEWIEEQDTTPDSTPLRLASNAVGVPVAEATIIEISEAPSQQADDLTKTLREKEEQIVQLKKDLEVAVSSTQFTGNKAAQTTKQVAPPTPAVDPCKELNNQIISLKRQLATKDQAVKKGEQDRKELAAQLADLKKKYDQLSKQKEVKTSSGEKPAQGGGVASKDQRYEQLKKLVNEQKQALAALEKSRQQLVAQVENSPQRTSGAASPATSQYTVKKGDTLFEIARSFYGNGNRWQDIYNANRDALGDGKNLKVGLVLTIPNAPAQQ